LPLSHSIVLAHIALVLDLLEQTIIEQKQDVLEITHIKKLMAKGHGPHFSIDEQGVVKFKNQLVVPKSADLRRKILEKAHIPICPFTQEATRCIMICTTCIGGQI
jgi:hypothetical protein